MKNFTSPSFWKCYDKLPQEMKNIADKNFELLKENPRHPSLHIKKVSKFLQEVKQELSKVSWPSRDELKSTTIVVIVLTLVFSLFIFGVDKVLQAILDVIY